MVGIINITVLTPTGAAAPRPFEVFSLAAAGKVRWGDCEHLSAITRSKHRIATSRHTCLLKGTCEAVRAMRHYRSANRLPAPLLRVNLSPFQEATTAMKRLMCFRTRRVMWMAGNSYVPGTASPTRSACHLYIASEPLDDGDVIFDGD